MHTHKHTYILTYIHTRVDAHTHIATHTHTYTYIQNYTHIHTEGKSQHILTDAAIIIQTITNNTNSV